MTRLGLPGVGEERCGTLTLGARYQLWGTSPIQDAIGAAGLALSNSAANLGVVPCA